jgi:N-methylhydantoinase A
MSPATAKRVPVATMESGPVGGIIAAAEVSRELGYRDVIAFDMGGTTAKVSLVRDNVPDIAQGYFIGGAASGHPVMLPVVDIIEVGAGGGSIAWLDQVGALKVGPRSAGGHPGPVCYSQGGTEPTVTDANVVLGRVSATRFLGGEMPLDVEAAREVERGYDPRDFALVAFGGAGPVHSAEIARELHIPTMIVPRVPGHFSALGMLLADLRHDYVRTYYKPLLDSDFAELTRIFDEMIADGRTLLEEEGTNQAAVAAQRFLDIRYVGQEFPIQTPVDAADLDSADPSRIRRLFDELHDRRFGHQAVHEPVEIVNLRLTMTGRRERAGFPRLAAAGTAALIAHQAVVFDDPGRPFEAPIYDRDLLGPGAKVSGPAVIWEYASTTLLFGGDELRVAESGELIVRIGAS